MSELKRSTLRMLEDESGSVIMKPIPRSKERDEELMEYLLDDAESKRKEKLKQEK